MKTYVSILCLLSVFTATAGLSPIPGGSFLMGDAAGTSGSAPIHSVNVSPFLMESNLVTYAAWTNVYAWATKHGYSFGSPGSGKKTRTDNPVQSVSWYDAVKWCNARSEMEGLRPCYWLDTNKAMLYQSGNRDLVNACVDWTATGYRLPTEAEWEKSARGGLQGQRFPWGNTISQAQANYHSYAIGYPGWDLSKVQWNPVGQIGGNPGTSPVGSFRRNAYGLSDMAGNVEEWCWDWASSKYYGTFPMNGWPANPAGPATGTTRITRGGAWRDDVLSAPCWARTFRQPKYMADTVGFRCARRTP